MPDGGGYTPKIYQYNDIYQLLINQGATTAEARVLAAIAMAESGGNPGAANRSSIENSYGLFQINTDVHDITPESAMNPVLGAQYALQLYRDQGGKPWTMYTNGNYAKYLPGGSNENTGGGPSGIPGSGAGGTTDYSNFEWPSPADYGGTSSDYLDVVGSIAATYARAGQPLPAGAPQIAQAYYAASLQAIKDGGQTPTQQAQAQAELLQIYQQIQQGNVLFPYTIAKIQQDLRTGEQSYQQNEQLFPWQLRDIQNKVMRGEALLPLEIEQLQQAIRLAEPIGADKILRTDSGAAGFRDYWSRNPLDQSKANDADYVAGYNLAKNEGDPERRQALTDYINTVINSVTSDINSKDLQVKEAVAEFQKHMDAWHEAGQQFQNMFQWSIPSGVEYVPGFEPGGFATSIGMQPWKAQPIHIDPFKMAQDIVNKTPSPAAVGAPSAPPVDWNKYKEAYDQLGKFLGPENM